MFGCRVSSQGLCSQVFKLWFFVLDLVFKLWFFVLDLRSGAKSAQTWPRNIQNVPQRVSNGAPEGPKWSPGGHLGAQSDKMAPARG